MDYNNAKTAKRYLIFVLCLLLVAFGISFFLLLCFDFNMKFTILQSVIIAILSAVIPAGFFTGFCIFGFKIKELTKGQIIAFCLVFPLILLLIILIGIIMILPCIIKAIMIIAQQKGNSD